VTKKVTNIKQVAKVIQYNQLASRDDALRDATDKFIADVIRGLEEFPTKEVTFTLPCTYLNRRFGRFNNIRVTAELHGQELTLKPI
jgi:hypothetical protein